MKSYYNILLILILLLNACKKDKDLGEAITLRNVSNKTKLLNHTNGLDYIINLDEWIINAELIIEPGVEIAVRKNGIIKVLSGAKLDIEGNDKDPIVIKGYKNEAWQGISIVSENKNKMSFVQLKNASIHKNIEAGIELLGKASLTIENSLIENTAQKSAIFVTENATLLVGNNVTFNDCFAPIQMELGANISTLKFRIINVQILGILIKNRNNAPLVLKENKVLKAQAYSYFINTSLIIDGAKLTIYEGVKIKMGQNTRIETGSSGNHLSAINMLGTPSKTIEIGTLSPNLSWQGICLFEGESKLHNSIFRNIENKDTTLGVVTLYNNAKASIIYCDFMYNKTDCSVSIRNKNSLVNNNLFFVNKLYHKGICNKF